MNRGRSCIQFHTLTLVCGASERLPGISRPTLTTWAYNLPEKCLLPSSSGLLTHFYVCIKQMDSSLLFPTAPHSDAHTCTSFMVFLFSLKRDE